MKLVAFKYGETELSCAKVFADGSAEEALPIALLFFLFETEDRKILIDTGCDTMPGFPLFSHQKPVSVLKMYGLSPAQITDVIITHAHHDHIDALRYYPQAHIHLHEDALAKAQRYLLADANVHTFSRELELLPGLKVRHIGGHAPGSSIVLIQQGVQTLLLCGDECYTRQNLLLNKPTASSYCPENSRLFTEKYGQSQYLPIIFHDPHLVKDIGFQILLEADT